MLKNYLKIPDMSEHTFKDESVSYTSSPTAKFKLNAGSYATRVYTLKNNETTKMTSFAGKDK